MLEVPCVDTVCDSVESLECPTKLLLGVECGYFCLCLKSSSITVFGCFFFFSTQLHLLYYHQNVLHLNSLALDQKKLQHT